MRDVVIYTGASRADVVNLILQPFSMDGVSRTVLYSAERGKLIWCVERRESSSEVKQQIACYELHVKDGSWGYANYVEGKIPHLTCPVGFLDAAPAIDPDWREQVLQVLDLAKAS